MGLDLAQGRFAGGGALDQDEAARHRVLFDRVPVVRSQVDVDADHRSLPDQLQQRGEEDERSAARDPRFDDDVRAAGPDHLLRRHHIGGKLDDGNAEPGPEVGVTVAVRLHQGVHGSPERLGILAEREGVAAALLEEEIAIVGHDRSGLPLRRVAILRRPAGQLHSPPRSRAPIRAGRRSRSGVLPGAPGCRAGPSRPDRCRRR